VLVTGVYGSGKSSVAAELADLLERREVAYGAIDLDWLTWFDVPGLGLDETRRVYLDNVANVTRAYRAVGVRHLVYAGAMRDRVDVEALRVAAGVPLRVVRLTVPLHEIARRLQSDPTTGRRDDVAAARRWLVDSTGVGVEDLVVANEGAVQDVAVRILDWLGWTRSTADAALCDPDAMATDDIDRYLAGLDDQRRMTLERLRASILAVVPGAEPGVSYGVPAFRIGGKVVAGFSASQRHLSYLPHSGSVLVTLAGEVAGYRTSKGSLHFSVDEPLPDDLVRMLVTARLRELGID
jgi:uncharacterized protein YdhG (YjbR/CyaY superfamily)/gluconate kinase